MAAEGADDRTRFGRSIRVLARYALIAFACSAFASHAQVAPSPAEIAGYRGLHAAAARGDASAIKALIAKREKPDVRDDYARTPLHVAAYGGYHEAMRALAAAGANPNALERDRYDIVTIAAVANEAATLEVALERRRGYGEMVSLLQRAGAR